MVLKLGILGAALVTLGVAALVTLTFEGIAHAGHHTGHTDPTTTRTACASVPADYTGTDAVVNELRDLRRDETTDCLAIRALLIWIENYTIENDKHAYQLESDSFQNTAVLQNLNDTIHVTNGTQGKTLAVGSPVTGPGTYPIINGNYVKTRADAPFDVNVVSPASLHVTLDNAPLVKLAKLDGTATGNEVTCPTCPTGPGGGNAGGPAGTDSDPLYARLASTEVLPDTLASGFNNVNAVGWFAIGVVAVALIAGLVRRAVWPR